MSTFGLTKFEINKIVYRYIGVDSGYLSDFSYRTHHEFYFTYCDLPQIDPYDYEGTTREKFITILSEQEPRVQAEILRGILEKYPVYSTEIRTQDMYDEIIQIIQHLEGAVNVVSVSPAITSEVVSIAIQDAETLIKNNGATSGVDRIHTALHGYLKVVCDEACIDYEKDASLAALYRLIQNQHPAFQQSKSGSYEITKIIRALSAIIDALNPIRNRQSVAHPNENLLEQPEAMLVINSSRTILNYLDSKITKDSS